MADAAGTPDNIEDVQTPCFLVNLKVLRNNADTMLDKCKSMGLKLRHMTKTHKCVEIAEIATNGSKRCISTSTLAEAEFFADNGFEDILCTCLVIPNRIQRLRILANRLDSFHVLVDSPSAVAFLESASLNNKKWSVYVIIDAGDGREGVLWDDEEGIDLVKKVASSPYIKFRGLYAHEGDSYDARGRDEIIEIGHQATERIHEMAQKLKDAGVDVPELGLGSTPTASHPSDNMKTLTELHPGNYIFYDAMQASHGSCNLDHVAVRVATRVVGHYPHRKQLLIDAGFTALSHDNKDRQGITNGSICLIEDNPVLRYVSMSQEYGVLELRRGQMDYEKYPIGSLLYLYPYHSCATASCHRQYYVHEDGRIKHVWKPCSGW